MKNALYLPVIVLAILCLIKPMAAQQTPEFARVEPSHTHQTAMDTTSKSKPDISKPGNTILYQTALQIIGTAGRYYQRTGQAEKFNRFQWEFHIVAGEELNCFVLPDGRIALFKGLVNAIERKEQLAYLVGHSVGHVLSGHRLKSRKQAMPPNFLFGARAWASLENVERTALGLDPVYSNADEREADRISLTLMRLAGYDLNESVAFLESMKRRVVQKGPNPAVKMKALETRINALKVMIPDITAQQQPLPQEEDAGNRGFPCADIRDTTASSNPSHKPTIKTHPVPKTGTYIFVLVDVIPSSGVNAEKITPLEDLGTIFLDEIVLDGFNYTRILLGDCPDLANARQKKTRVIEKGFAKALVLEYVDGKRDRTLY